MLTTIIASILLYTLVQAAYASGVAPGQGGDAPMVHFGAALLGPVGALILTLTAIASLLGNVTGGITGTARTTYAMSRDGLLPAWFGRVSARYATPVVSILFMGALVAALAISGSFVWLAVVSTLARMLVYGLSIAALPRLEQGRVGVWGLTLVGIGLCGWAAAQSDAKAWVTLGVLAGVGVPLYFAAKKKARE